MKSGAVIFDAAMEAFIAAGRKAALLLFLLLLAAGAGAALNEGAMRRRRKRRMEVEAVATVAMETCVMVIEGGKR